jgi:hypothetical protein
MPVSRREAIWGFGGGLASQHLGAEMLKKERWPITRQVSRF